MLEDLITRAVAGPDQWSTDEVIAAVEGRELFVRLTPESAQGAPATLITSAAGGLGNLVQAFTSRSRAGYVYGGMSLSAVVGMLAEVPALNGVHLINDNDDWVILTRDALGLGLG